MLEVIFSLMLVLVAVVVLALFYKRMNLGFPGNRAIKVVTAMPLGAKERLMVIEVSGQQHLIGVTSQQINHLVALDQPVERRANAPTER